MALLLMESFDGYGGNANHATLWDSVGTLSTNNPRTGSHRAAGTWNRKINPLTPTLVIGWALHFDPLYTGWVSLFYFGTYQCAITCDSDAKVRVRNGNYQGAVLAESAAVLVNQTYNFIEVKITVANAGSFVVKVNGVPVITGVGDTQAASVPTVTDVTFYFADIYQSYFDDIYVLDTSGPAPLNDFIGDCRIERLSPTIGNGANIGLTPSFGSDHGAMVDDLPANDDTDYCYGTLQDAKDTYRFADLSSTGTIKAVQLTTRVKKTDSATKQIAPVARLGGVDYDGLIRPVASTNYGQYQEIWPTRPSDGAPWTIADVNAAEFGLKVVS